jgi:arginase
MNTRSKEIHSARGRAKAQSDLDNSGPRGGRLRRGVPTLLGVPFDGQSSYFRGAAEAPAKIREALACDASNKWTETGVDLGKAGIYEDAGDLAFSDAPGSRKTGETWGTPDQNSPAAIEFGVQELIDAGKRPVSLGGDHSITYPIVKAFAKKYPELTIFHFDAHPDLYDEFEGNRMSHASPFARIMEAGLAKRLVQVGIRTMNGHQRDQAQKFGVEVVEMRALPAYEKLKAVGPVYVTFDMDVLDPAFAPGIFPPRAGRDVSARSCRTSARDRGGHRRGRPSGVQPGAGYRRNDGYCGGEDSERDSGEDDCGVSSYSSACEDFHHRTQGITEEDPDWEYNRRS